MCFVCCAMTVDISGMAFDSALHRSVHRQLVIQCWQMEAGPQFLLLPSSLRWVEAVKVCSIKMIVKKLAWGLISHWLYISIIYRVLVDQKHKWGGCVWRRIQRLHGWDLSSALLGWVLEAVSPLVLGKPLVFLALAGQLSHVLLSAMAETQMEKGNTWTFLNFMCRTNQNSHLYPYPISAGSPMAKSKVKN